MALTAFRKQLAPMFKGAKASQNSWVEYYLGSLAHAQNKSDRTTNDRLCLTSPKGQKTWNTWRLVFAFKRCEDFRYPTYLPTNLPLWDGFGLLIWANAVSESPTVRRSDKSEHEPRQYDSTVSTQKIDTFPTRSRLEKLCIFTVLSVLSYFGLRKPHY
jgi:hypothetical protein